MTSFILFNNKYVVLICEVLFNWCIIVTHLKITFEMDFQLRKTLVKSSLADVAQPDSTRCS